MEPGADYDLVWIDEGFEECPFCGEQVFGELSELVIIGEHRIREDVELGVCSGCGTCFGMMDDLLLVLEDEDQGVGGVERFLVNLSESRTGVLLLDPLGVVEWEDFRKSVEGLDEQMKLETPEASDVSRFAELPEVWQVGLGLVDWLEDPRGNVELSYVALIVDGEGLIRHFDLHMGGPHDAEQLARVVREATVRTRPGGKPGRPSAVIIDDAEMASALEDALRTSGIDVRLGQTPSVDLALADMAGQMRRSEAPPFFVDYDRDEIEDFLAAAWGFFDAEPWTRISGAKCVGYRFDGEHKWEYLLVLGQAREEFGFTVFEDWLQACLYMHNPPSFSEYAPEEARHRPLYAAGNIEHLTLEPIQFLHAEDGHLLKSIGARPVKSGLYPVARRYSPPLKQEEPLRGLLEYGALMEALHRILRARRAPRISSIKEHHEIRGLGIDIRYPATGAEELGERPGYYRLIAYGRRTTGRAETLKRRTRLEIDAPGGLTVDRLARMVHEQLGDELRVTGVLYQGFLLWSAETGRGAPSPTLAHLAPLSGVQLELDYQPYSTRVLRMEPADDRDVHIAVKASPRPAE